MSTIPAYAKAVAFTGRRKVELIDFQPDASPLGPDEVAGRTVASLVSPGTEINGSFDQDRSEPAFGGYAAVFEVTITGSNVVDLQPGQLVLSMGPHCAWQRRKRPDVAAVPAGLSAARAVFARLMAVSWATLTTCRARPPERVLVAGLGIVGNLAAQIFTAAGYQVTACDPLESRRKLATGVGLNDVRALVLSSDNSTTASTSPMLAIDCSGHESAVLDCCQAVAKGGEVVLIGVPWKKRTELPAFDLLHAVFHRYVSLRSGWEWELPFYPSEFRHGSTMENLNGALDWLASGRVSVDSLYSLVLPSDAQTIYDSLHRQDAAFLSAVFDWSAEGSGGH